MASKKTELYELERIGAKPVKNSGRGMMKGDGILEPFLVDIKEGKKSVTFSEDMWAKIGADSIQNGRRQPLIVMVIGDKPSRVWAIGESMALEMYEAWIEKQYREAGNE